MKSYRDSIEAGLGISLVSGPVVILAAQKWLIIVQQFINDHEMAVIFFSVCRAVLEASESIGMRKCGKRGRDNSRFCDEYS